MIETQARRCPYAGLQPYTEEDHDYFFGREEDQETVAANLVTAPLTILYGASGCGKTSILQAGVVPFLRKLPDVTVIIYREWQDRTFLVSLKECIARAVVERTGRPFSAEGLLLDDLLARAAKETRSTLAIILDQFEEYFLYHRESEVENRFDAEFARAVNRGDVDANFLLSLREDSLALLDRFQGRIPNLFDNYLRIERLNREKARDAIVKPIQKYKMICGIDISIETELVDAVLEQVGRGRVILGEGGQGVIVNDIGPDTTEERVETPYLQLVMTRLWDEETQGGASVLRRETLDRLGGAQKIAETHLDNILGKLSAAEQTMMGHIFRYLVTPGGAKIALGLSDLAGYAHADPAEIRPVLDALADQTRRILRSVAPSTDRPTESRYEIFHDVLAPAILRWCQKREQADAARQATLDARRKAVEEARLRAARVTRRLWWLAAAMMILMLLIAGLLLSASMEKNRQLKKMEIQNYLLQWQLETAQKRLEEHLVNIPISGALAVVLKAPQGQETLAFFLLVDDSDLEVALARAFVQRGLECARQSVSDITLEGGESITRVLSCPNREKAEEQALVDLASAFRIVENAEGGKLEALLGELKLKGEGKNLPKAVVAFEQARMYARQGRNREAAKTMNAAFDLQPSLQLVGPEPELAAALVKAGQDYAREADTAAALGSLRAAMMLDPKSLERTPEEEITKQLLDSGQEPGGQGLTLVRDAKVALAKGRIYASQGETQLALDAFRQVLALDPTQKLVPEEEVAQGLVDRGRELARQGQVEAAKSILETADQLNPKLQLVPEIEIVLEVGHQSALAGRIDEAVAAMERAIAISPTLQLAEPELSRALKAQATTAFSLGHAYTKILESLRQAAKYDATSGPEVAQFCVDFGQQYVRQGQTEAALAAFRLANTLDPNLQLMPEEEVERIQKK